MNIEYLNKKLQPGYFMSPNLKERYINIMFENVTTSYTVEECLSKGRVMFTYPRGFVAYSLWQDGMEIVGLLVENILPLDVDRNKLAFDDVLQFNKPKILQRGMVCTNFVEPVVAGKRLCVNRKGKLVGGNGIGRKVIAESISKTNSEGNTLIKFDVTGELWR